MDLVFDDDNTIIVRLVGNELVGGLNPDALAIASEQMHEIGASTGNTGPTGKVVQDLIDGVVSDEVKEVLAINQLAKRLSNQIEVRLGALVLRVFFCLHKEPFNVLTVLSILTNVELHHNLGVP